METVRNTNEQPNEKIHEAYKSAFKKSPAGLENWQIAKSILEILDNPDWIANDLAQDCIYEIVHGGFIYPDEDTKLRIIHSAEESAQRIFPGLKGITDVHMDQIEVEYRKKIKQY